MAARSPYQQLRQLEFFVQALRLPGNGAGDGADNVAGTDAAVRKVHDKLLRQVRLAMHSLRDYEQSEDDIKLQSRILPRAIEQLEDLRQALLGASEYDLVGAADVAQLSAELDELIDSMR